MTARKIVITSIAALVAFGAGYGLLGLAAPAPSEATAASLTSQATVLQALLTSAPTADGLPPNVLLVDATAVDGSARSTTGTYDDGRSSYDQDRDDSDDDSDDDHDDDHDDDRDHDDHD